MYHTPPRSLPMVNTRSSTRKNEALTIPTNTSKHEVHGASSSVCGVPISSNLAQSHEDLEDSKKLRSWNRTMLLEGTSKIPIASAPPLTQPVLGSEKSIDVKSKAYSKASSRSARRMKLKLEAAEAKARIEMRLIDEKLKAELAELDHETEYSSQPEEREEQNRANAEIEQWMNRSQLELETRHKPAPQTGQPSGRPQPPPSPPPAPPAAAPLGTNDGTVQLLASAIKDLATATASGSNAQLLSRLSTPRDLPSFSGDPMEWLYFRQAFEESSQVCNITEKENLWRLKKCLYGPAKEAVMALLISATSPSVIMSTLELQFGNPDVILMRITHDINKLQPLPPDYHKEIVRFSIKVQNYIAAVNAIGQDEFLRGMNIVSIILSKLPTILLSKWTDYSYNLLIENVKPKLIILSEFLTEEAKKTSLTAVNLLYAQSENHRSFTRKQMDYNRPPQRPAHQTMIVQNVTSEVNDKCQFCKVSKHILTECKKFKKALRKDRWNYVKRNRICYKCLVSKHNRDDCSAPACQKEACGLPHHSMLHFPKPHGVIVTHPVEPQEPQQDSETVTHVKGNNCKVLLKIVPINLHGPNGVISTVALLDDGSSVTLISGALAARAGLRGHKQTMRLSGAWDEMVCQSELVDLNVSNTDGTMFTFQARSSNELNLPVQSIPVSSLSDYDYINKIKDQLCAEQSKPEILIGQDNYHLILPMEIIKRNQNEPYVTRTPLGWCLHGLTRVTSEHCAPRHSSLFLTEDHHMQASESERILHDMSDQIRRYFSIDSIGITSKPRENSDDVKARAQLEQTATLKDGRWHVGLPWKNADCKLPDSFPTANSRLRGTEKKMKSDEGYAERYTERIQHLLQNDYAHELTIPSEPNPKTWYLPHFGVDNANKKKLRLVFDAAAKTSGSSLNDHLLTGPDLLMSLYGIMLRFRENKIAVAGDIKDMFLRVKILPQDQDALRFLWKDLPNGPRSTKSSDVPVKKYAMSSLIFGANCSPFVAQFIKNKNALRFESTLPQAVQAICKNHYVDDYIQSLPDEETAIRLAHEISYIHGQGGFELRNWMSNSEAVINTLPKEHLASTALRFKVGDNESERTLGLLWFPKEDTLGFDVSFKRIPECLLSGLKKPTKREILRVVMSIFDVYGFLSPFTIKGKIILQLTWRHDLGWDDVVPDVVCEKWIHWLEQLKQIHTIRLPRHYQGQLPRSKSEMSRHNALSASEQEVNNSTARATPSATPSPATKLQHVARVAHLPSATPSCETNKSNPQSAVCLATPTQSRTQRSYNYLQLHVLCDASTQAMCAVAYWRWTNENGEPNVAFIASKCRVAPNKYSSVPRLELQAAVLAARLADTIAREHEMTTRERYFWCDSSTVLHWIRNTARDYKQFVAHRLGEIDELTEISEWRYIPTKLNVADIATRDSCDLSVFTKEWAYGPKFLYKQEEQWPTESQPEINQEDLEYVNLTTICSPPTSPAVPEPERFSSWLRLLKSTCMVLLFIERCKKLTTDLDSDTMKRAERLLILYAQEQSFHEDLKNLKNKKPLEKKSKLLTLSPYLDEHGVLRVGGRINAAPKVSSDVKHPVILHGRCHVAMLIVRHYHIVFAHSYQETLVNELKQKYWIIRLRPTVKHVVSRCMLCRIKKTQPQPPRMGDLPPARMAHHQRPFTYCGVDLFGPMEVTVCRRREKRYGVLFTCLTVRAIHIEMVNNLTSDALIMALRRMSARRGWPQHLFSDNGTNLRGADTEMKRSIQNLDQDVLKCEAVNYGTQWTFIPPLSPHWGGAWERMIRSVKDTLKVVLKERAPRDEVLSTLMTEVENIVNSRPLTHVTVEPQNNESLTPNHFLMGTSSNLPILGAFDESDLNLRKQWKRSQSLADMFWRRWVREVLPDMRPRTKWHEEPRPLKAGDLVLIVDPNSPRNVWPRGIIVKVMPGKDGRVRVVEVKTKGRLMQRSATRIARIPIGDEC